MTRFATFLFFLLALPLFGAGVEPAYPDLRNGTDQFAAFPRPLETYPTPGDSIVDTLVTRAAMDPFN
ncbi:MAG TPA: hypothetical protein VM511_07390, partial [Luteolibacter sp.]|nr:hypothetical protein [Luteolibacter sp.]